VFGVRIEGLDTSRPLGRGTVDVLKGLMARHKLLLLPGGRLSVAQLAAFGTSLDLGDAQQFGATQIASYMSTCSEDDRVQMVEYGPDTAPADINIWHQDHSWHRNPTEFELSYIDQSPEVGGSVIYADAAAAYKSLSPRMQQLLRGCTYAASLANGYQNLDLLSDEYRRTIQEHPPIEQPVVTYDEDSGERMLNINEAYTMRIMQISKAESAALLPMLFAHIAKGEHCLRLQYEQGDICIFDNHKLQCVPAKSSLAVFGVACPC
jgi:taurine dioxygenase